MSEILLIRHGQASFGSADYDALSDLGQRQAEVVGDFLLAHGYRLDGIYCGTLQRQRQTARAVVDCYRDAGVVVPELIVDPGFNEMDNEAQINLLAPRLAQRDEHIKQLIASCQQSKKDFQKLLKIVFKQWQAGSLGDSRLQSWQQFKDGALAALETVRQQCGSGSTSAVFTSGGVIATLVAHVLRMPDSAVYSVFEPLINCSITRLLYGPERISLSSYNEYSYLQCSAGEAAVSSIISYR